MCIWYILWLGVAAVTLPTATACYPALTNGSSYGLKADTHHTQPIYPHKLQSIIFLIQQLNHLIRLIKLPQKRATRNCVPIFYVYKISSQNRSDSRPMAETD